MKRTSFVFPPFFMLRHPFPSPLEILITNNCETTISCARNRLREHALLITILAKTMGFSLGTDNARAHIYIRYLKLQCAQRIRTSCELNVPWNLRCQSLDQCQLFLEIRNPGNNINIIWKKSYIYFTEIFSARDQHHKIM